ncbi:MAG: hypothetical protein AAEJ47_02755 [Planctomycetota bacterium]
MGNSAHLEDYPGGTEASSVPWSLPEAGLASPAVVGLWLCSR